MFGILMFSFVSMVLIYIARDLGNNKSANNIEAPIIQGEIVPTKYVHDKFGFPIVSDPFDVFEQFLMEKGAFYSFFAQFDDMFCVVGYFQNPKAAIVDAFNWSDTVENSEYWENIHSQWTVKCKELGIE